MRGMFAVHVHVRFEVALASNGRCRNFWSLRYCWGGPPILTRLEYLLFKSLLLSLHLFGLFLAHEVFLHASGSLSDIEMAHLITFYSRVSLGSESSIFLLDTFIFSSLLQRLQSYDNSSQFSKVNHHVDSNGYQPVGQLTDLFLQVPLLIAFDHGQHPILRLLRVHWNRILLPKGCILISTIIVHLFPTGLPNDTLLHWSAS